MSELPHERALAKKLEGRPFVILGVNADATREEAQKAITAESMTWPQVFDGEPGTGKIVGLYNVKSFPAIYLVDETGVIRARGDVRGQRLEDAVEKLVKPLEAKKTATGH
jgi:AhpC/TSA family